MDRLTGIVVALLALGVMVTIHELGHYLMGRRLGFRILEFMIFMGPVLWSRVKNGIRYSLRLLPIGAAVQFAGELSTAEEEQPGARTATEEDDWDPNDPALFVNRPKRYRALVLVAGSLANILTGILIYFFLFVSRGYVVPVIGAVPETSQAKAAGLVVGSRIEAVNGTRVHTNVDLAFVQSLTGAEQALTLRLRQPDGEVVERRLEPAQVERRRLGITTDRGTSVIRVLAVEDWQNNGQPVFARDDELLAIGGQALTQENFAAMLAAQTQEPFDVTIRRGGEELTVQTTTRAVQTWSERGLVLTMSYNRLGALPYAVQYGWSIIRSSFGALAALFTGGLKPQDALSGPVGIVDMVSGVVASKGIDWGEKLLDLLNLIAIISLSLGFTNLRPIPLLDGNHLLLLGIEAIRGRRLSRRAMNVVSVVGLVMIGLIFAYGLYLDLSRIIGRAGG